MANTDPTKTYGFPSTHWSLVDRAGHGEGHTQRDALGELLGRYHVALFVHLTKNRNVPYHEAEDVLQAFFCEKVIRDRLIAHADQRRGKFRTFLLNVLDNFLISHYRHTNAKCRKPAGPVLSIEDQTLHPPSTIEQPSGAFEIEWARSILQEAVKRLEEHFAKTERPDLWLAFRHRVLEPVLNQCEPMSYDELVKLMGAQSPAQASNAVTSGKRCFHRILREIVGEYARDEEEIDMEIHELKKILSNAPA